MHAKFTIEKSQKIIYSIMVLVVVIKFTCVSNLTYQLFSICVGFFLQRKNLNVENMLTLHPLTKWPKCLQYDLVSVENVLSEYYAGLIEYIQYCIFNLQCVCGNQYDYGIGWILNFCDYISIFVLFNLKIAVLCFGLHPFFHITIPPISVIFPKSSEAVSSSFPMQS